MATVGLIAMEFVWTRNETLLTKVPIIPTSLFLTPIPLFTQETDTDISVSIAFSFMDKVIFGKLYICIALIGPVSKTIREVLISSTFQLDRSIVS
jgi:hypothetical protein